MVRLRMTVADIGRTRFQYSPLVEVAESLYVLASGKVPYVHRGWFEAVQHELGSVNMPLLNAVIPARPLMVSAFFSAPAGTAVTIDQQLGFLAQLPADQLRRDLLAVWEGQDMPAEARALMAEGAAGVRRLSDAVAGYWAVAIEPHWRAIRAVLDDDVAYRAAELTKGGLGAMFAALHAKITVEGEEVLQVDVRPASGRLLEGAGLLLMPSAFVWPNIACGLEPGVPPRITYPARGVGNLWGATELDQTGAEALGALLGRSRAAILTCLETAHSTTEIAVRLGQSKPAVSQHLAVLRQSGLVKSWKSGRNVFNQRTELATSLIEMHRSSARAVAGGA